MKNNKVSIRRLNKNDKRVLANLANNKEIFNNVRDFFPFPYHEKDAEGFIELCSKEDPPVSFGIEYNGDLAGVAGLVLQYDIYRKSAEIGYWIGEPYWNKGIATHAVKLIIAYAFDTLKLLKLYCGVFDTNTASQKVVEKCGFEKEGILKKQLIKNNQIMDEYRYGLVNPVLPEE